MIILPRENAFSAPGHAAPPRDVPIFEAMPIAMTITMTITTAITTALTTAIDLAPAGILFLTFVQTSLALEPVAHPRQALFLWIRRSSLSGGRHAATVSQPR